MIILCFKHIGKRIVPTSITNIEYIKVAMVMTECTRNVHDYFLVDLEVCMP